MSPTPSRAQLRRALDDADCFTTLYYSWRRWASRTHDPDDQLAAFAAGECARREAGLRRFGEPLHTAGKALGVGFLKPLTLFLLDFGVDAADHDGRYVRVDSVADDVRSRAAEAYVEAGGIGEELRNPRDESDPAKLVGRRRGVTDLLDPWLMSFIDKLPEAAQHVCNGGKLKWDSWARYAADCARVAEDASEFGLDPAPLLSLFRGLDPGALAGALQLAGRLRDAAAAEAGLSPGPLQPVPAPADELVLVRKDPHAPYWPASEFKAKYGIPAERLRQAKARNQIAFKKDGKRSSHTKYSLPDAMRLWAPDFEGA